MNNDYQTSNKYYRNLVFWVGILATFSYRIIIVLNNYSSLLVSIFWYIGTIGFIWYFAHRYRVDSKYTRIIRERKLRDKLCTHDLNKDDCEALAYILKGLDSSKVKWNSIAIFVFSALALAYAIISDTLSFLN
ncbi:MAG: hypothetical protein Q7T50_02220 [Candidatus Magasanikbacteria bacterium]|nr:hypothetical protein [Candidatus Magasanikbacteria bacterium]